MPRLSFRLPAGDGTIGAAPSPGTVESPVAVAAAQPPLRLAQRNDVLGPTGATPRIAGLGTGGQGGTSTQTASPRLSVGPNAYT